MNRDPFADPARNLLFGLLAFQLNFIDRNALLSAFDAWTRDPSQPLGRVLADRGAISPDLLALIEGLVAAHLAKHEDRPEKSLAALSTIGSLRQELAARADPQGQATLSLVSADRTDVEDDPAISYSGSVGTPTSTGVRFRVIRPLSQGGMGVVSVALDTELDRSIALKEIRDSAADDTGYRARFLAEAEITGKLEHPGIIPIYGLGTYADGRPFYAMRLIRGDKTGSLMDAIEGFHKEPGSSARVVEFRGLLRRFLDVCNAVSYAHSRGVLHRDLKPANILLGPYGETLVVDWGLAKAAGIADPRSPTEGDPVRLNLSGSELSPTVAGTMFGTPGYAPPEQMTGDLANVGPRSDVYGLGAILYCLATGRAAFSRQGGHLFQLIKRVEAGDFPPPRQVRPEVDGPLEAICLKAMARRPEDRYESVRALAADVEGYLADEPIAAYREPWAVRARRWTKRHRTAVSAALAALVAALVGLGAITAVQTRARNDLAAINGKLRGANASLDEQRRRSEDREARAIDAVKRFRDAVADEPALKNTPALSDLRKRLLKEPLAFFRALRDRLQADRDTRPESLGRLASASFDLGLLTDEIGDKRDALAAYRESLAIRRKLADAHPDVAEIRRELSNSHYNIGNLLRDTGRGAEAMEAYGASLAIRRKLFDADPEDAEAQSDLAACHLNMGLLLGATGRTAEALEACKSALAIHRKLADARPDDTKLQRDLTGGYANLGVLLRAVGELAESMKAFESALMTARKLADDHPSVAEFQSGLASNYGNLGVLQRETGNPAEALKSYRSALPIFQKLVDDHPTMTQYRRDLAACHGNLGDLLGTLGEPAEAMKSLESSLAIKRKLAEDNPGVPEFQSDLVGNLGNIGLLLIRTGKPAEAIEPTESALTIARKLAKGHPESPDLASSLGGLLSNRAIIDLKAGRFEEARARLREAVGWHRKALASNPANPIYRLFLTYSLDHLITAARGLGDAEGLAEAERDLAKFRDSDPAMAALDARLAAFLRGDQPPKGGADRLQLASRAYEKVLHATAARLWGEALAADPKLGDDRQAGHRYNAACSAAIAGTGGGRDEPKPDEAARTALRAKALGWLGQELSAWREFAGAGGPGNKGLVAQTLVHWKDDSDLAGVRDGAGLDKLPEDERTAWRALWDGVETLHKNVGKP